MIKMTCLALLTASLMLAAPPAPAADKPPSRAADKGCAWQHLSDASLGLAAWVQHCDFGFRKIDLVAKNNTIVERYFNKDGSPYPGEPDAVIHVFDLREGETPEAGIQRIFVEQTQDKTLTSQCVVKPYNDSSTPAGIVRFVMVPNAAYQKTIDARPPSTDIPDPSCGEWGEGPDGVSYFEAQPSRNARKVLFVLVGQEAPLFDEDTLRLLPARP